MGNGIATASDGRSRRRRVLVVTSNFPRWEGDSVTPFVLNMCEELCRNDWDVDVLAPHGPGAAKSENINGVEVDRFRYLWPESAQTVCYGGGALINLRKQRSNWFKIPALLACETGAMARRLITRKYDIVHAHWILPQGFVAGILRNFKRVPLVVSIHGSDVFALSHPILRSFKQVTLWRADAITANSSATESAARKLSPNIGTKLRRIPTGFVPKVAKNAKAVRHRFRRGDGPLVLFVGRLVEEKGVDDLIRAVSMLKDTLPSLTALIVGDGQDRGMLTELVKEQGVEDRIDFVGWVDRNEIADYYAASDIFAGPSKPSQEGGVEAQGLTFAESLFSRVPVIAGRCGGIPDIVRHEETGLLVTPSDARELACAIERLHANPVFAKRLAYHGYELVAGKFTCEYTGRQFHQLFCDLIQSR